MQASHLETSLAESDATVDTLGVLHHTLRNKDREWGVKVPVTTRIVATATTSSSLQQRERTVYVNRLNLWQKIRIGAFVPLLLLCLWAYRKGLKRLCRGIVNLF